MGEGSDQMPEGEGGDSAEKEGGGAKATYRRVLTHRGGRAGPIGTYGTLWMC